MADDFSKERQYYVIILIEKNICKGLLLSLRQYVLES